MLKFEKSHWKPSISQIRVNVIWEIHLEFISYSPTLMEIDARNPVQLKYQTINPLKEGGNLFKFICKAINAQGLTEYGIWGS
jgi:hypothetical protein